jgi:hypothetical protein
MKEKLIYSNYNKDIGLSTVIINTKYGKFYGQSQLKEEDKKEASRYFGCECALIKARIKCQKQILKDTKNKIKALKDCYSNISQSKAFNEKSYEAKAMRKQIYILESKRKSILVAINLLENNFFNTINEREELLKKINKFEERKKNG